MAASVGDESPKFQEEEATISISDELEDVYPPASRVVLIFGVLSLSLFLTSLDQTIVSTAIPSIASKFNSLDQVAWIPGAYFLTQAAFMVVSGQILTLVSTKIVYLCAILLFEIGSLICAVAGSLPLLIFGRALAGIGGAALYPSVTAILVQIAPLQKRPLLIGALGIEIALGVIIGPLLGGAFTDHVSWRWCFYINIPIGALAFISILFLLKPKRQPTSSTKANKPSFLRSLDLGGTFLCIAIATTLVLALQWGGNQHPWNSPTIIVLIVLSAALLVVFVLWERRRGEDAIVPIDMVRRRSQSGAMIQAFFIGMGMYVDVYYIPLWYQVQGHSATRSGVDLLPFLLTAILVAGGTGGIVNAIGRYWYIIVFFPLCFSLGSGLLFTVGPNSASSLLIGYQIICGIGIGGALQNGFLPVHAEYRYDEQQIPKAIAMVSLAQLIGGLVGVTIANAIFSNQLKKSLLIYAPSILAPVAAALRQSVSIVSTLSGDERAGVIKAYVNSLDKIFLLGIPAGVLAGLGGAITRNYNVKVNSEKDAPGTENPLEKSASSLIK